jgi:hypothetical protein
MPAQYSSRIRAGCALYEILHQIKPLLVSIKVSVDCCICMQVLVAIVDVLALRLQSGLFQRYASACYPTQKCVHITKLGMSNQIKSS